jgi:hypothetical protein
MSFSRFCAAQGQSHRSMVDGHVVNLTRPFPTLWLHARVYFASAVGGAARWREIYCPGARAHELEVTHRPTG